MVPPRRLARSGSRGSESSVLVEQVANLRALVIPVAQVFNLCALVFPVAKVFNLCAVFRGGWGSPMPR
jgi:hypothetical protein